MSRLKDSYSFLSTDLEQTSNNSSSNSSTSGSNGVELSTKLNNVKQSIVSWLPFGGGNGEGAKDNSSSNNSSNTSLSYPQVGVLLCWC